MGYESSIVTYNVMLGSFCVGLRVLHVNRNIGQEQEKVIGVGGYSRIYEKALISDTFVAKRTCFDKPTKEIIEMVILEAAFYILCSAFKIGPKF
jgi:hypothetical protein